MGGAEGKGRKRHEMRSTGSDQCGDPAESCRKIGRCVRIIGASQTRNYLSGAICQADLLEILLELFRSGFRGLVKHFRENHPYLHPTCTTSSLRTTRLPGETTRLRERLGDMTFAQFSRKLGFPPSTLHRLEQSVQSITLRGLQQILRRLKCDLHDIFPEDIPKRKPRK